MIYHLEQSGIDGAVGEYEEFCQEMEVPKKQAMMLSMSMDSMLTKMSAHYGEDFTFSFSTGKRFKRPFAKILWEGERYNPLETDNENAVDNGSQLAFFSTIYQSLDVVPHYTYRSGINIIQMPFKRKEINAMLLLLLAVAGGMVFGILTQNLPHNTITVLNTFADYVNNFILGLVSMAAAPMIFLSIMNGIVGVGSVHEVGKLGGMTIARIFLFTLIGNVAAILISLKMFPLSFGAAASGTSVMSDILGSLFGLFPTNIISPFLNANFAQIIGLAVVLGVALLVMGEKAQLFNDICGILSYAVTIAMEWFVKIIPVAIFTMFAQYVWAGTLDELLSTWRVFLVCILASVILFAFIVCVTAVRIKVPVAELIKMVTPPMFIGLSTASTSMAFYDITEICRKKLKLRDPVIDFSVPVAVPMYGPGVGYSFIAPIVFCASMGGIEVNFSWVLILTLLSSIFSMALPPVAGGAAACVPILLASLSMPMEYAAICTGVAVLFDYFATFTKCGEIVYIAALVSKKMDKTLDTARKFNNK